MIIEPEHSLPTESTASQSDGDTLCFSEQAVKVYIFTFNCTIGNKRHSQVKYGHTHVTDCEHYDKQQIQWSCLLKKLNCGRQKKG